MKTINKNTVKTKTTNDVIKEVISVLLEENLGVDFDHRSEDCFSMNVEVGDFYNCREYGHTYRVLNGEQDLTFCVYEHRNSDDIIINGCRTEDMEEYGPYNGSSKSDYLFAFRYNEHYKCASELAELLRQCYLGNFDEGVLL